MASRWQQLRLTLRHAFAVGTDPGPVPHEQQVVIDRICREIVRRELTVPALAFLEMSRPLNNVAAHGMHFLHPLATAVVSPDGWTHLAKFLERPDAVDQLCNRLGEASNQHASASPGSTETTK